MAEDVTRQIIQEDPQIEAYRLGLLESVQQFINNNMANMPPPPVTPPAYQVAGLSDQQIQAAQMAQQGIGSYQPYLNAGLDAVRSGQGYTEGYGFGALQEGLGATREGQNALSQAAQMAAEQRAQPYMYQNEATNVLRGATGLGYDTAQMGRSDLANAAQMGMGAAQQGSQYLSGTGEAFTPEQIVPFMNMYEDQVVQQAMDDLRREEAIRGQGLSAQAVGQGAFGGSRQALAEQELARNTMEQQARTAAQLRMSGYQQAGEQSQQAFEQAKQRQQQQAQLASNIGAQGAGIGLQAATAGADMGMQAAGLGQQSAAQLSQMGLGYGQLAQADVDQLANIAAQSANMGQNFGALAQTGGALGGQMADIGMQQVAMGQAAQDMGLQDVKTIEALGGRDQALSQAVLDAQRATNQQLYQMPYEQYGFLSDIYKGTPSTQQVTQISATQDPSVAQQVAGLGIAGLSAAGGASKMGLI